MQDASAGAGWNARCARSTRHHARQHEYDNHNRATEIDRAFHVKSRGQNVAALKATWYPFAVSARVDKGRLPKHVAIVMDGNGRWAESLGSPRAHGHETGSEAVRRIVTACRELGVEALTLYAFSEQNWQRPEEEVHALMCLLREFLASERREILDNAIRLRAVGRIERLPELVREVLDPLVQESRDNEGMVLTLALSYGGREEIADAARKLAHDVAAGRLNPDDVDEKTLAARLPSMRVGPVDLLIRTGGEQRVSNFLLWGLAYAELYFSEKLWPDMEAQDLHDAISAYQQRQRRFGRVLSDDVAPDSKALPSPVPPACASDEASPQELRP